MVKIQFKMVKIHKDIKYLKYIFQLSQRIFHDYKIYILNIYLSHFRHFYNYKYLRLQNISFKHLYNYKISI